MTPGKHYLIHCVDWHTFVGRFEKQVSPLLYGFSQVSKVSDTNNGDVWHDLVGGDQEARDAATYVHYPDQDELYELPIAIIAMPWEGELPKRD